MPPSHYEEAVARAIQRIRGGELEKVVLAREVEVHAPRGARSGRGDRRAARGVRSCYVFAVGRGEATFIAASPELLTRREGQRASTVALAGSTRRSADPAVDDHLGEQLLRSDKDREENAIVARRIARALQAACGLGDRAPEPGARAGRQHPAPRGADPCPAAPLRSAPSSSPACCTRRPAVGGEPGDGAGADPGAGGTRPRLVRRPGGLDRRGGDGEFCVALRCALLRGQLASCYAGCGIIGDSDPASELAETEIKLAGAAAGAGRLSGAAAARERRPGPSVQRQVSSRSVRTSMIVVAPAPSGSSTAARESGGGVNKLVADSHRATPRGRSRARAGSRTCCSNASVSPPPGGNGRSRRRRC